MHFKAMLVASALLGPCAINAPTMSPPTERAAPLSVSVADTLPASDRAAVQALVEETLRLIGSEQFAANLGGLDGDYRTLWLSPYGDRMSPAHVAQIYLGRHADVRSVPTVVTVDYDEDTPWQGFNRGMPLAATITLTPKVLERWKGASVEQRSCAVNTMAHELGHTFTSDPARGEWVFADGGKGIYPGIFYGHLASYTIGSVAQCTMLQQNNALGGGFAACLKKWGTDRFNNGYCGDADPAGA